MLNIDWGDVPNWLGAVVSGVALFYIARTMKAQTQQLSLQERMHKDENLRRRKDSMHEYSKEFTFWVEDSSSPPLIHFINNSVHPIYNVTVHLIDKDGRQTMMYGMDRKVFGIKYIPQGKFIQTLPVGTFALNESVEIHFNDARGVQWKRLSTGEIKIISRRYRYPERWLASLDREG